jgi:hypothetical protein
MRLIDADKAVKAKSMNGSTRMEATIPLQLCLLLL